MEEAGVRSTAWRSCAQMITIFIEIEDEGIDGRTLQMACGNDRLYLILEAIKPRSVCHLCLVQFNDCSVLICGSTISMDCFTFGGNSYIEGGPLVGTAGTHFDGIAELRLLWFHFKVGEDNYR